jgi:hypothetical protein
MGPPFTLHTDPNGGCLLNSCIKGEPILKYIPSYPLGEAGVSKS